jgi:hypothetical protein
MPFPFSPTLSWSFCLYLVKSASYEAPHYTVFSNLLSLHLFSAQIFSAPCSQTPLVCVFLCMRFHLMFSANLDRFPLIAPPVIWILAGSSGGGMKGEYRIVWVDVEECEGRRKKYNRFCGFILSDSFLQHKCRINRGIPVLNRSLPLDFPLWLWPNSEQLSHSRWTIHFNLH